MHLWKIFFNNSNLRRWPVPQWAGTRISSRWHWNWECFSPAERYKRKGTRPLSVPNGFLRNACKKKQNTIQFKFICVRKKQASVFSVLLAHHILNALLDLGERDGLGAVEEHADYSLQTAEHLGQDFVFEGQGETRRDVPSKSVITLIGWKLLSETNKQKNIHLIHTIAFLNQPNTTTHSSGLSGHAGVALASSVTRSAFLCWTLAEISRAASSRDFSSASVDTGAGEGAVTRSDRPFSFCSLDFNAATSSLDNVFCKSKNQIYDVREGTGRFGTGATDPHALPWPWWSARVYRLQLSHVQEMRLHYGLRCFWTLWWWFEEAVEVHCWTTLHSSSHKQNMYYCINRS